jgi:hypothetical protein
LHKGVPVTLHDIQDTSCNPAEITVNQLIAMKKDEAVWGMVQILYCGRTKKMFNLFHCQKGSSN